MWALLVLPSGPSPCFALVSCVSADAAEHSEPTHTIEHSEMEGGRKRKRGGGKNQQQGMKDESVEDERGGYV